MSIFKNLFKQTVIYGLATVIPRMLSFILLPLYTGVLAKPDYAIISILFAFSAFMNVILAYGMETAFFRFYHDKATQKNVTSTALISIALSSIVFVLLGMLFTTELAQILDVAKGYVQLIIWILFFDALVIIPFALLRAKQKSSTYSIIKIANVAINLGLNIFFLVLLKDLINPSKAVFWNSIWFSGAQITYVLIANLIASAITFVTLFPAYFRVKYIFDASLFRKMLSFGMPIMIAGLAYAVNEVFDRFFLNYLLPEESAKAQLGAYAACYKLALFITLFVTAFRLGIEPFFFSHSKAENAKQTYATITKYFVLIGLGVFLSVIVFIDVLKVLFIRDSSYWEAMAVVPYILLANLCLGVYFNLSVWYKITDKTKFGAYFSVAGAVVTIILNLWLIPKIGYKGSAFATLAAYATMMFASYFFSRKYYVIPYNLKKIGAFAVLALSFSAISFLGFRGNLYIGILLISLFFTLFLVSEKNELKRFLKS